MEHREHQNGSQLGFTRHISKTDKRADEKEAYTRLFCRFPGVRKKLDVSRQKQVFNLFNLSSGAHTLGLTFHVSSPAAKSGLRSLHSTGVWHAHKTGISAQTRRPSRGNFKHVAVRILTNVTWQGPFICPLPSRNDSAPALNSIPFTASSKEIVRGPTQRAGQKNASEMVHRE